MHVALHHAKSLTGLVIVVKFKREFVKANPDVIQEYVRLQNDLNTLTSNKSLHRVNFINLLNIQSICKHMSDFHAEKHWEHTQTP